MGCILKGIYLFKDSTITSEKGSQELTFELANVRQVPTFALKLSLNTQLESSDSFILVKLTLGCNC